MNKIEFVGLKAQAALISREIKQALDRVMSHGQFIMGPEVAELEKRLADFTGARYSISCSSGTDALLMALMAIGVGSGDAVFTSPFTFIATAEVISLLGAVPIFVDIDEHTFNLDPVKLERTIKDHGRGPNSHLKPRCILPVDIFGLPADYESIQKIARKYDMLLIEDAAQSLGARSGEQMAGNLADIAATSFFPAKPLGGYGDGGAIFTNSTMLAEKLISIRVHGKGKNKYDNIRLGINGRLDTLQAAVLIQKLKIFSVELEQRRAVAHHYMKSLNDVVQIQRIPENVDSAWAQFTFLSSDRMKIMAALDENQIPNAIYYPKPLHLQEAFYSLNYKKGDLPVAEKVSEEILSIPMHPYLEDDQIEFIARTIVSALNG